MSVTFLDGVAVLVELVVEDVAFHAFGVLHHPEHPAVRHPSGGVLSCQGGDSTGWESPLAAP